MREAQQGVSDCSVFTYQTRLAVTPEQGEALDGYATLYGVVERSLFAAMQAGGSLKELKRAFLRRFDITARQFNAIRVGLEGKIRAIKARRPELITESEMRIHKTSQVVAKLESKARGTHKLHQKKRRLALLQHRITKLKEDEAQDTVRLCFGSKKQFHAQFNLESNGYTHHAEWKADWQQVRSNQFFVLGSQDETAGCQGCQVSASEEGALRLQLRLPNALATSGKYLILEEVRFAYGQEAVLAALRSSRLIHTQIGGKVHVKRVGSALSYRFLRDEKGWRVFVSVKGQPVETVSHRELGAIGVDINGDHLAVSETDRFGNLLRAQRIDLPLYGKTTEQAKAVIGDAVVTVVAQAKTAGKPLVVEQLSFQKKKAALETAKVDRARTLSAFAYNKILQGLKAASFRAGIEVIEVNPAYTSVIGAVNFAQQKGISVHQGAAYAIARRGLGFSEHPIVRLAVVPTRNGGHVTFVLPVRNRTKPVWSFWSNVRTKLKAAQVAHYRLGDAIAPPSPLISAMQSVCSHRSLPAQSRYANRSQHCSESVLDLLPF